jgi:hypothetical protein
LPKSPPDELLIREDDLPKRVIDGDAMWASTKLSECPEWMIPFYPWLYPLADANGSFELTNLRVIWCKVAAILPHLAFDTFAEIISTFENHGLLFAWTADGKRYGHWTGSEKPGRLPQPARRTARYGPLFAPVVPRAQLLDYQLRQTKCRTATAEASPVLVLDLVLERDRRKESRASHAPTPAPAAPDVCERLIALWNAERGPLPEVLKLTEGRRKKILARLQSDPEFPQKLLAATRKARKTAFLCGAGDHGWKADLDWLIANDTHYIRVLEGRYEGGKGGGSGKPTVGDSARVTLESIRAAETKLPS